MALWLATRLTDGLAESIPMALKTLAIISAMAEQSSAFRAAALKNCAVAVGAAQTFNRADPIHGDDKPALVRVNAEKLTALLNKREGAAALSMGGGLFSRGKAKAAGAAKMADKRGRQAAKFTGQAMQAKAAADGSMLGATTAAGGGTVVSSPTQARVLAAEGSAAARSATLFELELTKTNSGFGMGTRSQILRSADQGLTCIRCRQSSRRTARSRSSKARTASPRLAG